MSTQTAEDSRIDDESPHHSRTDASGLPPADGEDDQDPGRRLSVHLIGPIARIVRGLAARNEMKVSDVVKASVASFEFLDDHVRRGNQILIEDPNGRLLTVPWPPRSPH